MEYHGLADLTLKYRSLGGEKSATCSGITVQLFREPNWRWTVIFHDPTNQAPLDGLIRAAERTPNLGGNFTLIEDRER